MQRDNKLYARVLLALLWGTGSVTDNDKLCDEAAKEKRLYRWGTPKKGELVLRRISDGFKVLKTILGKDNEIVFLKTSFARACRKEYERKFLGGDELQIMRMVE